MKQDMTQTDAVLAALGHIGIPVLAVMAFGLGTCEIVFAGAAQAILPDLVAKPLLHKANGNQQTIATIGCQFLGPPIGSLLGGLVSARVVNRAGALPTLLTALATNVVVFVGIGLSPNAIVLGALLAVNGFVITLWTIVTVSLRQQVVPSEMLGRVNGVYKMLGWGLIPLGALAGGLVAHTFGLRAPYPVAGVLRGVALLVAMPVLIRAMRDQ